MGKFVRLLSPSGINLYFQCPRKFYYRYILKLPMKDSIHTVRGTIVHTVLEKLYDIDENKLTNVNYKKVIYEYVSNLFEKEWQINIQKLNKLGLPSDELEFYYKDSQAQLDKWLQKFIDQLEKKLKEEFIIKKAWKYYYPTHRELKLLSNGMGLIGYVDQVLTLGDRHLVIDFKTSKSPKLSPEYNLQLACYNLMYHEKYNVVPETFLWFLKFGLKKVPISKEIITDTKFKIEQVHQALKSSNILDYPKNITPLCKWSNANGSGQCDFYDQCFNQKELIE